MSGLDNEAMLAIVARRLGSMRLEVVFLGGATVSLLLTDPAAREVRATTDVDGIIDVKTLPAFHATEKRLRAAGFKEDTREDAPVCRWLVDGVTVDLMPPVEHVLGFTSRWYRDALAHSVIHEVDGLEIRLVSAPYFLATKIEAFRGRGRGDYRSSSDLEDIIAIVDGREDLPDEVAASDTALRKFIANQTRRLLRVPRFVESVAGHLLPDGASQKRVPLVLARLRLLAAGR